MEEKWQKRERHAMLLWGFAAGMLLAGLFFQELVLPGFRERLRESDAILVFADPSLREPLATWVWSKEEIPARLQALGNPSGVWVVTRDRILADAAELGRLGLEEAERKLLVRAEEVGWLDDRNPMRDPDFTMGKKSRQ
jgi:hypothetical protein